MAVRGIVLLGWNWQPQSVTYDNRLICKNHPKNVFADKKKGGWPHHANGIRPSPTPADEANPFLIASQVERQAAATACLS